MESADGAAIERTAAELRAARGDRLGGADLDRYARDPLFQAAARVRLGLADVFVCGAVRTTADVLRASLWLVGLAPGTKTLSSFFLMVLPGAGGATASSSSPTAPSSPIRTPGSSPTSASWPPTTSGA